MIVRFEHRDENVALQADERDAARPFKTGSRGFNASGKVTIDGKRYQVSCNLIEIGSKPTMALTRGDE